MLCTSSYGRTNWPRREQRACLTTFILNLDITWPRSRGLYTHARKERAPMSTGTVKWFNGQKGFGFIQPSDGGKDVFVHISAVEQAGMSTLNEGQQISYEVIADRRTGKSSAGNLRAV